MQERILARRSSLYNSHQMYFECDAGIFGEDGCYHRERFCRIDRSWLNGDHNQAEHDPHEIWYRLIQDYGPRKQNYATDKLPAMSGLAQLFAKRMRTDYVAGIWSDALLEGIVWTGLGTSGPVSNDQYIAPSWSWASYNGMAAISKGTMEFGVRVAKFLEWSVQLKSDANPFGEVDSASIKVRAPVVKFHPITTTHTDDEARRERPVLLLRAMASTDFAGDVGSPHDIQLDHSEQHQSSAWKALDLKVMLVVNLMPQPGAPKDVEAYCYSLVVVQADGLHPNRMRRMGWTRLRLDEADRIQEDQAT